ncbi:GntR family transcriptional regulator [Evansella sp. LMS18]|nr:GntR family transcriptional regulator [Evansella sp. LMS18]UTR11875.1 GntR family transcriptional regulator [Evansella sp. LMS18]
MVYKKLNKRQYAYEVIKGRILDGTYVPGQRIIIDQIAKEVGSSHIPVREAIHQLEADQLIKYRPNSGAVVLAIDETLYKESLEMLALLEGYATVLSVPFITEEGISRLASINETMREAVKNYELEVIGSRNKEFHFIIYSYCPNEYLINNINQVWERLDTVRRTGAVFFPKRAPESVKEHDQIIKLLSEKKDMSEIERFSRQHKLNTLIAFEKRKAGTI